MCFYDRERIAILNERKKKWKSIFCQRRILNFQNPSAGKEGKRKFLLWINIIIRIQIWNFWFSSVFFISFYYYFPLSLFWRLLPRGFHLICCFCVKSITIGNCQSSYSCFSVSRARVFEIVIQYSWFCKSLNLADWGGELSFFGAIHLKINMRIGISISIRSMATKFVQQLHLDWQDGD